MPLFQFFPREAWSDFESRANLFTCPAGAILVREGESPSRVLFQLEGKVMLSMNSSNGRRLILGIAKPGDIVGLATVVTDSPSGVTTEAQSASTFASLTRQRFLDFLSRHPAAWQVFGRQLSVEYNRACERFRIVGMHLSASIKLARLLLDWSAESEQTDRDARIYCPLTHGEIGQHIGVSREKVTRILGDLRSRNLVNQQGPTLVISSLQALERYAGGIGPGIMTDRRHCGPPRSSHIRCWHPDAAFVKSISERECGFYESAFTHANVGRLPLHAGGKPALSAAPESAPSAATAETDEEEDIFGAVEKDYQIDEDAELNEAA